MYDYGKSGNEEHYGQVSINLRTHNQYICACVLNIAKFSIRRLGSLSGLIKYILLVQKKQN